MTAARLTQNDYERGIRDGDRVVLARAITLVESDRDDDRALADALLEKLLPSTGNAVRVGVTGVPGVGKSTLLDALGIMRAVIAGHDWGLRWRGLRRNCPTRPGMSRLSVIST